MNRRSILKGLFGLGAAAAVPLKAFAIGSQKVSETIPTTESLPSIPISSEPKTGPANLVKTLLGEYAFEYRMIPTDMIWRNGQSIREWDKKAIKELAEHIRQHGLINPILVRPIGNAQYAIIDGLCRWHAANEIGLKEVPCTVRYRLPERKLIDPYLIFAPTWSRPVPLGKIDMMINSINQMGQLQDVLVNPMKGGRYEIIDGHCRVAALKSLDKPVQCQVCYWSSEQVMEYQILQNKPRRSAILDQSVNLFDLHGVEDRVHRLGKNTVKIEEINSDPKFNIRNKNV